jgi:hypothetical protein
MKERESGSFFFLRDKGKTPQNGYRFGVFLLF